jgi:outer membrane receptor protein involved in Fe transport
MVACLIALLLLAAPLRAAETGKLVLEVRSAGQPVAGANVVCEDPPVGGATDLDGRVVLLGLPPGLRRLRVTHVGCRPVALEAWLISHTTTRLAVELEAELVRSEDLVVRADRLALPLDRTSRMAVLDGGALQDMGLRGLSEVLTLEAGVTRDESGALHVRGGRAGELKFLVDGVEVQDPWSGTFRGVVNEDEVQELVLVAGAFNAEYGDAMSGVVNIVSRQGASRPGASLRYESGGLLASPWRRTSPFAGVADEEAWRERRRGDFGPARAADLAIDLPGRVQLALHGPLAAGWEGRAAWLSHSESSPLPHGFTRQGDLRLGLGRAWKAGGRLDLAWERSRSEELPYLHSWKYLPGNQARTRTGLDRLAAGWSRPLGARLLFTGRLSWLRHEDWSGVADSDGNALPLSRHERPILRAQQDFVQSGHSPHQTEGRTEQARLGLDATWQTGRHEWKSGLDLRRDALDHVARHNVWSRDTDLSELYLEDRVEARPLQGAFYVQDKLELDHLVLHGGLRLDARDPDTDWLPDPLRPFVEEAGAVRLAREESVPVQWALSPRLGMAFPFADDAVLRASWGHFLQFAPLSVLYANRGHHLDYTLVPLMGNPRVKPQRTTAWELGLTRRLDGGGELGIGAWHKDLRDLLSTRQVVQYTESFFVYHNTDYANVRGVDLSWSRPVKLGRGARLQLAYTWMSARGNAAEPESGVIRARSGEEEPFNEFPLDYEQAHDLSGRLAVDLAADWRLDLAAQAGSGLPYTPFVDVGVTVPSNSANRPWVLRTDAALRWRRKLGPRPEGPRLEAWLAVENLLDRRNVVRVYPATGKPFDDPRGLIGSSPDALHDPSRVEAPRQLRLGLDLSL